jgi:hypothetical protein
MDATNITLAQATSSPLPMDMGGASNAHAGFPYHELMINVVIPLTICAFVTSLIAFAAAIRAISLVRSRLDRMNDTEGDIENRYEQAHYHTVQDAHVSPPRVPCIDTKSRYSDDDGDEDDGDGDECLDSDEQSSTFAYRLKQRPRRCSPHYYERPPRYTLMKRASENQAENATYKTPSKIPNGPDARGVPPDVLDSIASDVTYHARFNGDYDIDSFLRKMRRRYASAVLRGRYIYANGAVRKVAKDMLEELERIQKNEEE